MPEKNKPISFYNPVWLLATFFGAGKSPIMPGTSGSLAGLALIVFLFYQPHDINFRNGEVFYSVGDKYINL